MIKSKLVIDGVEVPFFSELPLSTNYVIADIRDPDKRQGSYTKSIRIPGTKEVNILFEYIFELNIQLSTFNPNKIVEAIYFANTIEQVRGNLQILSITEEYDGGVKSLVYDCQITGTNSDLFQAISTKFLTDIDLSDLDHAFTYASSLFTPTAGVGYGYGYIDYGLAGGNGYNWRFEHMKPYVFEKEYVDRIFAAAGFTYTSGFLTSNYYKHIVTPCVDEGALAISPTQTDNVQFYAGKTTSTNVTTSVLAGALDYFYSSNAITPFVFTDDTTPPFGDPGNIYNTGTGTATLAIGTYNTVTAIFNFTLSYAAPALAVTAIGNMNVIARLDISNPFTNLQQLNNVTFNQAVVAGDVVVTGSVSVTLPGTYMPSGSLANASLDAGNGFVTYLDAGSNIITGGSPALTMTITSATFFSSLTDQQLPLGGTVEMNTTIPKDVKQLDFLKGIINAENLYIELDKNNPKNYIIEKRDTFIVTSTSKDWTKKQDLKPGIRITPMGELNAKTYLLKYKSDKDEYNALYEDFYKETYGQQRYNIDNDFVNEEKKIELVFSPTPGVSLQNNIVAPRLYKNDGTIKPLKCNIRRLYYGGMKNCDAHNLNVNGAANVGNTVYQYPFIGHLDDPASPILDLCFAPPKRLFYTFPAPLYTNNNLSKRGYDKMIAEISDPDSKIVESNFFLTETDIYNFSFRNMIFVNGTYFFVNKILDYDPQVRKSVTCELLKLKDGIIIPAGQVYNPWNPPLGLPQSIMVNPNFNYNSAYNLSNSLAVGTNVINNSNNGLISGVNTTVPNYVTDFNGLGMNNTNVTERYSGKVVARNGAMVVGDRGFNVLKMDNVVKTANFTITDEAQVYFVNAIGGNIDITLPDHHSNNSKYTIVRIDNTANVVTVRGITGTELLKTVGASATSATIAAQGTMNILTNTIDWFY